MNERTNAYVHQADLSWLSFFVTHVPFMTAHPKRSPHWWDDLPLRRRFCSARGPWALCPRRKWRFRWSWVCRRRGAVQYVWMSGLVSRLSVCLFVRLSGDRVMDILSVLAWGGKKGNYLKYNRILDPWPTGEDVFLERTRSFAGFQSEPAV